MLGLGLGQGLGGVMVVTVAEIGVVGGIRGWLLSCGWGCCLSWGGIWVGGGGGVGSCDSGQRHYIRTVVHTYELTGWGDLFIWFGGPPT